MAQMNINNNNNGNGLKYIKNHEFMMILKTKSNTHWPALADAREPIHYFEN